MKRKRQEEDEQKSEKKRKMQDNNIINYNLIDDTENKWSKDSSHIVIHPKSRWYNNTLSLDEYMKYLNDTDLIVDVPNLQYKTFAYVDDQCEKIIEYLRIILERHLDVVQKAIKERPIRKFWPIVGLRHSTSYEHINSILKHGLLPFSKVAQQTSTVVEGMDYTIRPGVPQYEELKRGYGKSFSGIYLLAIRAGKMDDFRKFAYAGANIVIDPYILNRHDYHVNTNDQYGKIWDTTTYSRNNMIDLLDRLDLPNDDNRQYTIGEIVFHNVIEPMFFKYVNIPGWKLPTKLDFYETDNKVLRDEYETLLLDETKHPPIFCTYFFDSSNARNVFKVARNCGFTQDQILGPEFKELWQAKKLIRTKSEEIISGTVQTPKTWYYPPFESSPLTKQDEEAANKYLPKL